MFAMTSQAQMIETVDTPTRGRPGGEESRARLVAAAARLFAARGFDGVSVRELAAAADVNVAAVSYHFGGKRGLYLSALEQLLQEMRPVGRPVIERIEAAFAEGPPSRDALAVTARFLVRHILTTLMSGALKPWVTQTVLREFQDPTPDYRPMLDERVMPLHLAVARLSAAALRLDDDSPEAILAAHGIMGQIMVFAAARNVILEELDWPEFGPEFGEDRLETIIAVATRGVLGALGLNSAQEAE